MLVFIILYTSSYLTKQRYKFNWVRYARRMHSARSASPKKNRSTFACACPYGNRCFASLNCKFCPWLRQIQNVAPSDFVGASFRAERITKKRTGALLCSCSFLVTRTGIEPMFPAWEASVLTAWPTGLVSKLCYYTTLFFKLQYPFWKFFLFFIFFLAFSLSPPLSWSKIT